MSIGFSVTQWTINKRESGKVLYLSDFFFRHVNKPKTHHFEMTMSFLQTPVKKMITKKKLHLHALSNKKELFAFCIVNQIYFCERIIEIWLDILPTFKFWGFSFQHSMIKILPISTRDKQNNLLHFIQSIYFVKIT